MKCRDCRYLGEEWLTSYDRTGLLRCGSCRFIESDIRLIDSDAERECENFEPPPKLI